MKKKKLISIKKLTKKQIIIACVTGVVLITGGIFGITEFTEYKKEIEMMEKSVVLYPISGSEKVFMNGIISPVKSQELFINPEQGELSEVKVSDGQIVSKGEVLFTCRNTSQINEIADLNNQIALKKKENQNAQDEESKAMIDTEIKDLNNQVSKLNKTAYSTVYAPFAGKIYIEANTSSQNQSNAIMTIESTNFYVKAQVNERDSYKVQLNQNVEITALATKDKYSGYITEIGDRPVTDTDLQALNTGNNQMTNYEIKIKLEKQDNLKSGLHIQGVAVHESQGIKVPTSAIERDGTKHYVFKVEGDIAIKTEVKIEEEKDEFTIISSGVSENEEIIKEIDGKNINDGDKVYTNNY